MEPVDLPQVQHRRAFHYVEHAVINKEDGALSVLRDDGSYTIPIAMLACLMIGPGCSVTSAAMSLIAECGATAIWCGENGTRLYCAGTALTRSSANLLQQAKIVSDRNQRTAAARRLYGLRWTTENVETLTVRQLLGREGVRVASQYEAQSKATGVTWTGRHVGPTGDPVNKALSTANACLYGVVHAVILAVGLAPALGVIHNGDYRSLVYDIADLYKVELTIPLAFQLAAESDDDITGRTRKQMVVLMQSGKIIPRCISDLRTVFQLGNDDYSDAVFVWNGGETQYEAGRLYGETRTQSKRDTQ